MESADQPDQKSADFEAMEPYWNKVYDILEGEDAIKGAKTSYLPKFPKEQPKNYEFRLSVAKFTNIFRDIVEALASKPFSRELGIKDDAPDRIKSLIEDIDGRGNHLHVFSADVFFWGIANSIDWILVDYTRTEGARTVEQERQQGARPYWVRIPANKVIKVDSAFIGGMEVLTEVRYLEGPDRVRIYERNGDGVTWRIEQKQADGVWLVDDEGPITIGVIPMVPFVSGQRKGSKWQFHPPMRDSADLQLTLYRNESDLEYCKTMTCFPMLAGNGVNMPTDEGGQEMPVPVGPQAVLYAPPNNDGSHGEWSWIEPDATSLKFVADEVTKLKKDLRELGRQPLTAQSSNLTVVTTMFAAQKGNSAVQAWALKLKDALEVALKYTAMWAGEDYEPEVKVHTDFEVLEKDDKAVENLIKMRTAPEPQISQETLWDEMKRRGVLSPEFDADEETQRLFREIPGGDDLP